MLVSDELSQNMKGITYLHFAFFVYALICKSALAINKKQQIIQQYVFRLPVVVMTLFLQLCFAVTKMYIMQDIQQK